MTPPRAAYPTTTTGVNTMRSETLLTSTFAALLLIGAATAALAQSADQDHDAHHPAGAASDAAPAVQPDTAAGAPGGMMGGMMGGMPGMMGMMTPEMMEQMQMMRGMTGEARPGAMSPMMGMGRGMPEGMGPMRDMQRMMAMCPMMQEGMGAKPGMAAMPMRGGVGPSVIYGLPKAEQIETTPEKVRAWLEDRLAHHANPRLAIGEIAPAGDGSITAEIVTVDGSLVQKLAFNRWPGFARRID
jgi:hypothetical protein